MAVYLAVAGDVLNGVLFRAVSSIGCHYGEARPKTKFSLLTPGWASP